MSHCVKLGCWCWGQEVQQGKDIATSGHSCKILGCGTFTSREFNMTDKGNYEYTPAPMAGNAGMEGRNIES